MIRESTEHIAGHSEISKWHKESVKRNRP